MYELFALQFDNSCPIVVNCCYVKHQRTLNKVMKRVNFGPSSAKISRGITKVTNHVRLVKTQIRLSIRPVCSVFAANMELA